MAEESTGYDTNTGVGEAAWAVLSQYLGVSVPVVGSSGSLFVKAGTSSMTVDILSGISYASGHRWSISTTTNLTIATVSLSGAVRWDAVILRRDWSNNSNTLMVVQGSAAVGAAMVAPTLLNTPGDKVDQLLALVKASNGSTALDIRDRRIYASKDLTVKERDSLPTAANVLYGTVVYVTDDKAIYRCLSVSGSAAWVADAAAITELTGTAALAPATGWTADGTHVNRALVQPYSRQIDVELRRSGADLNADNTNGRFPNNPYTAVCVLAADLRPDRPMPINLNYLDSTGREYGGDGRLNPDGSLYVLGGKAAINLAQSTAVGTVSIRASIRFDRRTA